MTNKGLQNHLWTHPAWNNWSTAAADHIRCHFLSAENRKLHLQFTQTHQDWSWNSVSWYGGSGFTELQWSPSSTVKMWSNRKFTSWLTDLWDGVGICAPYLTNTPETHPGGAAGRCVTRGGVRYRCHAQGPHNMGTCRELNLVSLWLPYHCSSHPACKYCITLSWLSDGRSHQTHISLFCVHFSCRPQI